MEIVSCNEALYTLSFPSPPILQSHAISFNVNESFSTFEDSRER